MKTKIYFIFFIFLFSLNFINLISSVQVGEVGEEGVKFVYTTPINYSSVNTNNSQYLQGYTPFNLPYLNLSGTTKQSSINYNGSDILINPKETGTGKVYLQGITDLNNNSIQNTQNITPRTTNLYSLGTSALRYVGAWLNGLNVDGNANITGNLVVSGNLSYKNAYGNFLDNTTQNLISTTAGQPMNFSITTDNYLVNMIGKQNITVLRSGDYEFIVSALGYTTSAGADKSHINIWFQKNGVNINLSNTKIELPTKESEIDIVVPFIIDLNSTDNLRIMWNADNANCQLVYYTNTSFIPATPSVILTVKRIGDITP